MLVALLSGFDTYRALPFMDKLNLLLESSGARVTSVYLLVESLGARVTSVNSLVESGI